MKLVHKAAATAVGGFVAVGGVSFIALSKADASLHHMRAGALTESAVSAARSDVVAATICLLVGLLLVFVALGSMAAPRRSPPARGIAWPDGRHRRRRR